MRQYLRLLWLLVTSPKDAWHVLSFSRFHPTNWGGRVARWAEYRDMESELPDVLSKCSHASVDEVSSVLAEFRMCAPPEKPLDGEIPAIFDAGDGLAALCYSLVRLVRPRVVVETGVARGITSYYILRALERNGEGHLFSIDFRGLRPGKEQEVGAAVAPSLRDGLWTLLTGPGVSEMRKLRTEIAQIDLFLHDSSHRYRNQLAEYRIALDWLGDGGILISDDVENDALVDAAEEFEARALVIRQEKPGYIGVISDRRRTTKKGDERRG